ncbi:MAG: ABC transporter ATP-binding protein [Actinomycetota bacterium]|nr:ABC transporter ATP-binding protein [Actinomycetota bacterium]
MTALLEVEGLVVHYGIVQALRGVSFTLQAGEMVALVGANGAGKTTTLRTVSGLLKPTSGRVSLDGDSIAGLAAHKVVARGVAHLPEGRELFSGMTVRENLELGAWSAGGDARAVVDARFEQALDLFPRLRERLAQSAGTLSGGEQQMLGVARALMSDPRLLIIDELSLGLAPLVVEQLFDILRDVNARGTAVLIVEQFVNMALANTDRAYVLAKGEVVMEGPSRKLLDDPALVETYLGAEHAAR